MLIMLFLSSICKVLHDNFLPDTSLLTHVFSCVMSINMSYRAFSPEFGRSDTRRQRSGEPRCSASGCVRLATVPLCRHGDRQPRRSKREGKNIYLLWIRRAPNFCPLLFPGVLFISPVRADDFYFLFTCWSNPVMKLMKILTMIVSFYFFFPVRHNEFFWHTYFNNLSYIIV